MSSTIVDKSWQPTWKTQSGSNNDQLATWYILILLGTARSERGRKEPTIGVAGLLFANERERSVL